jgi:hypothetical protein
MRTRIGCSGPISLGTTILLMMPWAMEAARLSRLGKGSLWWRAAPLGSVAILIATMSRGPIIAALVFPLVNLYFRRPALRRFLIGLVLILGFVTYLYIDQVASTLHSLINSSEVTSMVIIDGQPYVYNGTVHRTLLYKVYREPMRQAGLFGFDMNWPPLNPPSLSFYFFSVDNTYIAQRVRRGLVGLLILDLLIFGTLRSLWRMTRCEGHPLVPFAERMLGGMVALTLALFTVGLFMETRSMLLMTAGLAAWMDDSREAYQARMAEEEDWRDEDDPERDWPDDEIA